MWVTLQVGKGLEDDDRAELADQLREELLTLAVGTVEYATADPRGKTKAADLITWGSLVVSIASIPSLRVLIDALASWIRRQPQDITVEIEGAKLTGTVSAAQRDRLVDAFENRLRASTAQTDESHAHTTFRP